MSYRPHSLLYDIQDAPRLTADGHFVAKNMDLNGYPGCPQFVKSEDTCLGQERKPSEPACRVQAPRLFSFGLVSI